MTNPMQIPDRRRIYLMRHAEAAYVKADGTVTDNPRQVALTSTGKIQARKQAALLASIEFDRAICSGLPRTVETAEHMLAFRKQPGLDIVPELEEITGAGHQRKVVDVEQWLAHVADPWAGADQPEARFLGGELFADFAARVVPAFEAILEDTSWRTLLLVLHGAVNRMIFNHIMNLPWQSSCSIEQDNCCINVIDVDAPRAELPRRYLIRCVNLTGYDLNKSSLHLTTMEATAARIREQFDRH